MIKKLLCITLFSFMLLNLVSCKKGVPVVNVILENNEGNYVYQCVLDDGNTKKIDKFTADQFNKYIVDTLSSAEVIDGVLHKSIENAVIYDDEDNVVEDTKLDEILKIAAKLIDHDIYLFEIFELNGEYYAFIELNVNWQDPCYLYHYDFATKELNELHVWQDVDLIGLQIVEGE